MFLCFEYPYKNLHPSLSRKDIEKEKGEDTVIKDFMFRLKLKHE